MKTTLLHHAKIINFSLENNKSYKTAVILHIYNNDNYPICI